MKLVGGPADGEEVRGNPDGTVVFDRDLVTGEERAYEYRRDWTGRLVLVETPDAGGQ